MSSSAGATQRYHGVEEIEKLELLQDQAAAKRVASALIAGCELWLLSCS